MKIIGLTGPIASGKDEVAKILRRKRIPVIDADSLAHTLYIPPLPLWHKIVKAFGSKILNRGGRINRKKLGEIVFADPKKLKLLNSLVHPELKKAVIKEIESRASNTERRTPIIVNAAVLKEIGLLSVVDEVWVVMAKKEIRLKRLLKKGLSKKQAQAHMQSQMSKKDYLNVADVVIENEGTKQYLKKQVLALLD